MTTAPPSPPPTGRASSLRGSGSPENRPPPWWSFSGRGPCVTAPGTFTFVVNGSGPDALRAYIDGMMAIDSYHDARFVSYVPETLSTSPLRTPTRQSGGVTVIATSHETAPAGSKYFASERNSGTVRPSRVSSRSVHSPPGCRCPPDPTSAPSSGTVQPLAGAPFASSGYVKRRSPP